jgi:hypothetical protein
MAKRINYTSKTLDYLRKEGYHPGIVERFIPKVMIRRDLYNIIDIIAMGNGSILGVQSTGANGRSAHRKTILNAPESVAWLRSGGGLWLVTWAKLLKKRGGKQRVWTPRIEKFSLSDFSSDTVESSYSIVGP